MKYLNKNIEEIGKVSNAKTLINRSVSCGVFSHYDFNSPRVKDCIQSSKNLLN